MTPRRLIGLFLALAAVALGTLFSGGPPPPAHAQTSEKTLWTGALTTSTGSYDGTFTLGYCDCDGPCGNSFGTLSPNTFTYGGTTYTVSAIAFTVFPRTVHLRLTGGRLDQAFPFSGYIDDAKLSATYNSGSGVYDLTCTVLFAPSSNANYTASIRGHADYDVDNDNLIEISTLAQLNAVRWDRDGNGAPTGDNGAYAAAFPNAVANMGCASTGAGYELAADLDFDTNSNGTPNDGDAYWNGGKGWDPLGEGNNAGHVPFTSTFVGNGHPISNLYINRTMQRTGG